VVTFSGGCVRVRRRARNMKTLSVKVTRSFFQFCGLRNNLIQYTSSPGVSNFLLRRSASKERGKMHRGPHPYKISSLPASDKGTRLRNAFGRQHSAKQGRKSSTIAPNGLGIYHDDPSKCSNAVQFDDNFIIIKDLSLKATVCLLIFPTLAPPGCLM